MKKMTLSLVLLLLPMMAHAQGRTNRQAVNAAQDLVSALESVNFEATQLAQTARMPQIAQQAQHLASNARQLARQVDMNLLRALQRGTNEGSVNQALRRLEPSLERIVNDANRIRSPIVGKVQDAARRVEWTRLELGRALTGHNGPGRPGPGPGRPGPGPGRPGPGPGPGGPGYASYESTCRVVLETVFGNDLRDFFETARGMTQAAAEGSARQQAQHMCQRQLNNNFHKCTFASCDTRRIR